MFLENVPAPCSLPAHHGNTGRLLGGVALRWEVCTPRLRSGSVQSLTLLIAQKMIPFQVFVQKCACDGEHDLPGSPGPGLASPCLLWSPQRLRTRVPCVSARRGGGESSRSRGTGWRSSTRSSRTISASGQRLSNRFAFSRPQVGWTNKKVHRRSHEGRGLEPQAGP